MSKIDFRLEREDPHWIRLNDPDDTARERADWWINDSVSGQSRATIDIHLPELQGEAKISVRWAMRRRVGGWSLIGLHKSKNGAHFVKHWEWSGLSRPYDRTYKIDLDPGYQYYRIIFNDGNLVTERSEVHKNVSAEGPGIVPVPVAPPLFYQALAGSALAGIAVGVITAQAIK